MEAKLMSISLVMPTYNEEQIIEKVVRQWHSQVVAEIEGSEFIIVNDGSTDSTFEILERLKSEFPALKIIHLKHNIGHGKAVRVGFNQVKNPVIFQVDSDNQFKAEDFWKLYQHIDKNDIVLGFRGPRMDHLDRRIVSMLLRFVNMIIFGIWVKDINSPFKLIKAEVLGEVVKDTPEDFLFFPIIFLIAAKCRGYRIAEVRVTHYARQTGKSTLAHLSLLRGCIHCLKDIMRLKMHLLFKKSLKMPS